jgi:hypothetical protein
MIARTSGVPLETRRILLSARHRFHSPLLD